MYSWGRREHDLMVSWWQLPVFFPLPRTIVSAASCIGFRVLVRIASSFETHQHCVRRTFHSEVVLFVFIFRSDVHSSHVGFGLVCCKGYVSLPGFPNVFYSRMPILPISSPRSKSLRTSGRWRLHFRFPAPAGNRLFKNPCDLARAFLQKFRGMSWEFLADLCESFWIPLKP